MHSKVCLATVVEARNSFVSLFFVSIIILIMQMWVDHASTDQGRREEARDTPTRTSWEAPECEIEQPKAKADACYPSRVIDNPSKDAGCHNRPQDMENRASRSLSHT
jgi:hypothetical protein